MQKKIITLSKKLLKNKTIRIATTAIVIIVIFFTGVFVGGSNALASKAPAFAASIIPVSQPNDIDFSPVWKSWELINEKFVPSKQSTTTPQSATDDEKVWGMIQGLAASLKDPYTVFMPPSEAEMFQDDISGSFEGVGMEIAVRDRVLTVVSPLKDTPAWDAGLKPGDKIIKINGISTKGFSINRSVKMIRGPKGTVVTFTVLREGESEELIIKVTRDKIDIPTIKTTLRDDNIFVIELFSFTSKSPQLFKSALQEFSESGTNKLILDLRGNPGGYLQAAVDMASWFLPSGKVVVTEDYGDRHKAEVHRSKGYNVFNKNLEMLVLVDRGSASASEILAGALRDHGVATLVGTKTFGKGSVQELIDITKDTSLKITVARWLLPDGENITGDGLEPEIKVDIDEIKEWYEKEKDKKVEDRRDLILEKAVEYFAKLEAK